MQFIFMLTHNDTTVPEAARRLGLHDRGAIFGGRPPGGPDLGAQVAAVLEIAAGTGDDHD